MDKEEGYNSSETGNWNSAKEFSRVKIMNCLTKCEAYENIAEFGYDTLSEEFENFGVPPDNLKLMGFKRLIKELIKLINNSKFALKKKGTKSEMEKYQNQLEHILNEVYSTLYIIVKNQRLGTKKTKINEVKYDLTLKAVLSIKSNINSPLNRNNLIFNDKEEFDPVEYKKKLKERYIEGM